jgi:hypothetical protein
MKNTLMVASMVGVLVLVNASSTWSADTVPDVEVIKRQSLVIPGLQRAASTAAGYTGKEVEVLSTAHQVSIVVSNSKLNDDSAANREAEASKMVSAVENQMARLPEFAQVAVVHVDYLKRSGSNSRPVQAFDFYKSPAGAFVIHRT